MEYIEALDLGSLFTINKFQQQTPWLVPVFRVVAYAGSMWVLAAVAVLALVGLSLLGRWPAGLLILIAFLASAVVTHTMQPLVGRFQPDVKERILDRPQPDGKERLPDLTYGFPNGAAATSSATYAMLLLSLLPLLRSRVLQTVGSVGIVALVLAIGFSQMYLAWGYLSDVVGGWALGLSLALFCRWLDLRWSRPASA
jgi:membrane-associated phospholipid phosphatase